MKNLKENFERACNAYLKAFCDKHGYEYEPDYWVAGDVGTIIQVGDDFVDMVTIRTDIDRHAPEDEFREWDEYCTRLHWIDHTIATPNFEHWLTGYPRKSEEELQELERLHERVEEAREALGNAIKSK